MSSKGVFCFCFSPWDSSRVKTQNSLRKLLSGVSAKVIEVTSWLKCVWMTRTHSCCVSKSQTYFIRTIQLVCYFYLLIVNTLWYGLFPSLPMPRIWQGHHVSKSEAGGGGGRHRQLHTAAGVGNVSSKHSATGLRLIMDTFSLFT